MRMASPQKNYLPNLDALRFFASGLVLIAHFERTRVSLGGSASAIWNFGRCGYTLFFTLSGFLITYTLLKERDLTGKINLKKFYLRRILRIWPLYYAVLFYEYLSRPLPADSIVPLTLSLLMLPNLSIVLYPKIYLALWTWAIGVHEQFYVLWPWLIRSSRRVAIAVVLTLSIGLTPFWLGSIGMINGLKMHPMEMFPYHLLGIGSLFGFLAHSSSESVLKYRRWLFTPWSQLGVFFLTLFQIALATTVDTPAFAPLAITYGALIFNLALNPKNLIRIDTPILNYLGRRSFAIFMIHIFVLRQVLEVSRGANLPWFFTYVFGIGATILLADIVYRLLEWPFLKLKRRLEVVKKR
jgi:peptidoglycan/LPS O-acetylase OafA/YrhL